ncbi:putative hydrolase of the HAD superfamily [Micromonospora pisi]|uniref:Putative hydrolase of the HAD superfamily n=1 Tax=Micromonospora pisi TaxID=589240 RepID=A0A495JJ67_9ACTN|nr:HAD family hydrolase [Micromonospora pisi]RKR88725.1 putative hydrolase of the HAD superfamily [Micromonospora pisi]
MPAYRAVLFDFFNTLTRPANRGRRHTLVADQLGCTTRELLDVLDQSFYLRASGVLGNAEETLRWVCERIGVRPSDTRIQAALTARLDAVRADTRLRPEAVPTLRALRQLGIATALVSDCTHELPVLLAELPVAPLLDTEVYSVQVGCCKPDPMIYLTACQRLGVAPGDCLYVGDGGSRELTGAVGTGLAAVRLLAPDLGNHLVFDPDTGFTGPALTSLREVIGLVEPAPAGTAHPVAVRGRPAQGRRRPALRAR